MNDLNKAFCTVHIISMQIPSEIWCIRAALYVSLVFKTFDA